MGSLKLVVLLIAVISFCSLSIRHSEGLTVLEIIQNQTQHFSGLYRVLSQFPELVNALNSSSSNFTVFAPINQAINATVFPNSTNTLPILQYHVSTEVYMANDIPEYGVIHTLLYPFPLANNSQVVIVDRNATWITVNGARVTLPNIVASNGVIHGIDAVLSPPSQYIIDVVPQKFSTLNSLVTMANLDLKIHGFTLFAPTNQAFAKLPQVLVNYLEANNNMSRADLQNILKYHGIDSIHYTPDFPVGIMHITTANGDLVSINKLASWPNTSIVLNGNAPIVQPDILTLNGVIHGIDNVLVPPNFNFTLEKAILGLGATTFLNLLQKANLTSTVLDDSANRTVFVPTNAALNGANLNLTSLLYHVVDRSLDMDELTAAYLVPSLLPLASLDKQNQVLKFVMVENTTTVLVNGVPVANETKTYNNNYVYLIDSVLDLPGNVNSVLASNSFTILGTALNNTGLSSNLSMDSALTIFAPTDEAFNQLPPGTVGYLLNSELSGNLLQTILENHVLSKNYSTVYYSTAIPNGVSKLPTMAYPYTVTVNKTASGITVDGVSVVDPDLIASNGVVHGIDQVLIPANITFSVENIVEGVGNFTHFLSFLNDTGLLDVLSSPVITVFAPDDDAFANVENLDTTNKTQLTHVLMAHFVYRNISQLSTNETINVASNQTIFVLDEGEIELRNPTTGEAIGSTASIGVVSKARNGYLYGIDHVLGTESRQSSSGGMKTWVKILIAVAGVIVGLLLLVLIGGAAYFIYNTYSKNRSGYRKIND